MSASLAPLNCPKIFLCITRQVRSIVPLQSLATLKLLASYPACPQLMLCPSVPRTEDVDVFVFCCLLYFTSLQIKE